MHSLVLKSVSRVVALAILTSLPVALVAQTAPAATGTELSPSKWDIFAGYSALIPNAHIHNLEIGPNGFGFNSIDYGAILSISRYFNKNVGITFVGDEHILLPENGVVTTSQPQDDFSGGSGGVIYRIPTSRITPFFHALIGADQVGSYCQKDVFGLALTAGGGFDFATPMLRHHLGVRFQGDYQYIRVTFAPPVGSTSFNPTGRISAGLVYSIGSIAPPPPVTLACSASPTSIFPGDPVTVTAAAGGLDPKDHVIYTWSGTGVTGKDTTATVDTGSLAAGTYTVNCGVKEGKPGKEGLKPWESATASATFTVKAFEPPTISCSVNPSTIKPGDTATITSIGMSPQSLPLTYSYSASAGTVSGSGTTAEFSSAGAATGAVGITCNVSDDKGQSATGTTTVTILAPPAPAPLPHASALCSISFSTDVKRPTRVDNEAKACLDQVALTLKQQTDAKVVIVGESNAAEKADTAKKQALAAKRRHVTVEVYADQRAVNAKDYLVTDQGIDASRITVATGSTDGQTEENYLVPAGANFSSDVSGTTSVDESTVKSETRKPLPARHHAARK